MSDKKIYGPDLFKRDENGLLGNVEYVFNEDGSVNWRAMIKPEFLYPNKGWFDQRNQETPKSLEGLSDKQLLIMLGGIKELAKLRGFNSVGFKISHPYENHVVAQCSIEWMPNYETNNKTCYYEDAANATRQNTDDFCVKFLETIACNRAFVRCVRNFLNIHIVGADEIDRSKNSSYTAESPDDTDDMTILKPSGLLEKTANENKISSFDEFVVWLRSQWQENIYRNEDAKNWKSYKDVPAKECRKLISILKKS